MSIAARFLTLKGKLIVSCQAPAGDVFADAGLIARFAQAALAGGAAGIRANGPGHIRAIRAITDAPIIGIQKIVAEDGKTLITPSFDDAAKLVNAGADIVALDVTSRGQQHGALGHIHRIKSELRVPVFADIATVEEALAAANAGADAVLSTLHGYTADTADVTRFEPEFIEALVSRSPVPVIAEGRIHNPEQAAAAIAAGAFCVIVGTAITRPGELARRFADAVSKQAAFTFSDRVFLAIDLGGTNTKIGIVSGQGDLLFQSSVSTPALAGRESLLNHLKFLARELLDRALASDYTPAALGVATAGWVNRRTGTVAYATDNLPGWTGTKISDELTGIVNLRVSVENDANAFAIAEKQFGAGRGLRDFVCITLGTGVGGGCYVRGELNHGAHYFANALGHIPVVPDGTGCTCGKRGCLEAYCNPTALLSNARGRFSSVEKLVSAANDGDTEAVNAILAFSRHLGRGCSILVELLDPEALILSGGIAQNNPILIRALTDELAANVPAWQQRHLEILVSPLGYYGGVLGAAAVAMRDVLPR